MNTPDRRHRHECLTSSAAFAFVSGGEHIRAAQAARSKQTGHRPRGLTAGPTIGTHAIYVVHFVHDFIVRSHLPRYINHLESASRCRSRQRSDRRARVGLTEGRATLWAADSSQLLVPRVLTD